MPTARMNSDADVIPHRVAGYGLDDKGGIKNHDWVAPARRLSAARACFFR